MKSAVVLSFALLVALCFASPLATDQRYESPVDVDYDKNNSTSPGAKIIRFQWFCIKLFNTFQQIMSPYL